jgi:hypothetical protein
MGFELNIWGRGGAAAGGERLFGDDMLGLGKVGRRAEMK